MYNFSPFIFQGVLRQIPLVGSVLNWFSPVQASVKGRTFNLAEGIYVLKMFSDEIVKRTCSFQVCKVSIFSSIGCLDSTEPVYSIKAQMNTEASPDSPKSSTKRFPGNILI